MEEDVFAKDSLNSGSLQKRERARIFAHYLIPDVSKRSLLSKFPNAHNENSDMSKLPPLQSVTNGPFA
jgi:hypothetical protein